MGGKESKLIDMERKVAGIIGDLGDIDYRLNRLCKATDRSRLYLLENEVNDLKRQIKTLNEEKCSSCPVHCHKSV